MLLLTCLCLVLVGVRGDGEAPPSPCPEIFRYVYDAGRWSGMLRVPVPDPPRRIVAVVTLFVVDAHLPPEHPGELQLLQDEITVKEKIRMKQMKTVVYVLELPIQDPLPVIDKIKVNKNIICEGPLVKARNRTKVTYTHRLYGLRQQPSDDDKEHSIKQQSRILNKEFVANRLKEQQNDFEKEKVYNKLELMENEREEFITQEEDIFPSKSGEDEVGDGEADIDEHLDEEVSEDGGLEERTGPEFVDEDSVEADSGSNPNGEAEMLDVDATRENTPYNSAEDEDEFEDDSEEGDSSNEAEATSNNAAFDPNKDAEMLEDSASGQNIYEGEEGDGGIFEEEDDSGTEADSTSEDVEMIDNKVSEAGSLKPKYPDPSFKTIFNGEEFEDFSDNELNPIYYPDMPDNVIYP